MSGISDRLLEKRLWGLRPITNKIPPTSVVVFHATLMNLSELKRDLVVKFVCPNSLYFKDMIFHGFSRRSQKRQTGRRYSDGRLCAEKAVLERRAVLV